MDDAYIGDLLVRWARYIALANRGQLGYARPSYNDMVGAGAYGSQDAPPPVAEFDVLAIDEIIREKLPRSMREILWLHYVMPGTAKSKHGIRHQQYYAQLRIARTCLGELYEETLTATK